MRSIRFARKLGPLEGALLGFFVVTAIGSYVFPDRNGTVFVAASVWPIALLWRFLQRRPQADRLSRDNTDLLLIHGLTGSYGISMLLSDASTALTIETVLLLTATSSAYLLAAYSRDQVSTRAIGIAEVGFAVVCLPAIVAMAQDGVSLQNRLRIPELGGTNLLGFTACGLILLRLSSSQVKARHLAAIGLSGGVLLLTFSRAALVALGLGIALMFMARATGSFIPRARRRRATRRRSPLATNVWRLVAVLAVVGAWQGLLAFGGTSEMADRFLKIREWRSSGRGQLIAQSLDAINDHPFTGTGPRLFEGRIDQLELSASDNGATISSHNQFLQFVLELGVPLGLAALVFWLSILYRAANKATVPVLAAFMLFSLTATFLDVAQVQWIFALFLARPLATRRGSRRRQPGQALATTDAVSRVLVGTGV